jgi:hypothetical protein
MHILIKSAMLALGFSCIAANAQVAVVTGPSGPAVTQDQLTNVYLGRSKEFKPLDLPEGDATRDAFYRKGTEREPSQVKALWARVVFSGKGQAPLILPDAGAIKKAVNSDPKAVGYIPKAEVDGTVKVLMTLE